MPAAIGRPFILPELPGRGDALTVAEKLRGLRMRPLFLYATAAVLAFGVLGIQQHSEFIYFRF